MVHSPAFDERPLPLSEDALSLGGRPLSIVVVDDCPVSRMITEEVLEQKGAFVLTYESPREAVNDVADGIIVDIVLVDSELWKGIGGDEIIAAMKDAVRNRKRKIFIGTYSSYEYPASGADFCIVKGDGDELIRRVRTLFDRIMDIRRMASRSCTLETCQNLDARTERTPEVLEERKKRFIECRTTSCRALDE